MEKLGSKNFLWCMVNQDKIDTEIERVEGNIRGAFDMFNVRAGSIIISLTFASDRPQFAAHINNAEFLRELQQARTQDQRDLNAKLEDLANNGHRIIDALQDQGRAQRRMEDILIAVAKACHLVDLRRGLKHLDSSAFTSSAPSKLQKQGLCSQLALSFSASQKMEALH
jgi:hypothetical protein